MKKIKLSILAFLVTITLFAQAPQKMSYQAVIRNASNTLVSNQTVAMRISILQGSSNGTSSYVETQTATTNVNGLVSIEIGTGSVVSGNFSTINWSNGPYFIKTETDITGGTNYTITGTSQLLSVPYALYAANGTQWNNEGNNITYTKGNVGLGVGLTSPNSRLYVNGNLSLHTRGQKLLFRGGTPSNMPEDSAVSIYRPLGDDGLAITGRAFYVTTSYLTAPIVFNYRTLEDQPTQTRFIFNMQLMRFGVGTDTPKSSIHVASGDVYLSNTTNGVILTAPNGQCYRVTVNNTGTLTSTLVPCP